MGKYILRRLLLAVPNILLITMITFALMEVAPGDPVTAILIGSGQEMHSFTPEALAELRRQYGLDQPAPVRYVRWLSQLVQGNLGRRLVDNRPITEIVARRALATLELMVVALTVAVAIGIVLGVISALKQYSFSDYFLTIVGFVGVSLPEFFIGILFIAVFAVKLHLMPVSGMNTAGQPFSLGDHLHHLAMPAIVLALHYIASILRYTRASLLEVLRQDYVTVARAKGLRERLVIMRHAFRNALLPVVTVIGLLLPSLIAGAAIVEVIFQWPGMGTLYLEGVNQRDHIVTVNMLLIFGTAVILANLLTDLVYAVVDPRIRYT